MVFSNIFSDVKAVLRGLESVVSASVKHQVEVSGKVWRNSSVKSALDDGADNVCKKCKSVSRADVDKAVRETIGKTSAVLHGFKTLASYSISSRNQKDDKDDKDEKEQEEKVVLPKGVTPEDLKPIELDYKDKLLIQQLEMEHDVKVKENSKKIKNLQKVSSMKNSNRQEDQLNMKKTMPTDVTQSFKDFKFTKPVSRKNDQPIVKSERKKQELSPNAKQRKVPSSRLGRFISFGSLAAGLGVGTIAEVARRTIGGVQGSDTMEQKSTLDQIFLTEANANRIVNTLCRVRGAALKIGQILSIQDSTIISPTYQQAFERVRQSADFMPTWQVNKVLLKEIGEDWRDKISAFEEKPFAAASIGQVHYVRLKDGREAAMKIQYPGVAEGIESDINNLVGILKIWNFFPKGLFIDNLVEVAKRELAWEVDYLREAECTKKFKYLLAPYPDYVIPEVIDELTTSKIFTTTLVDGVPIDKCVDLKEEDKKHVSILLMQLCLRELFEFRYMQTDPNWSNFFYDQSTRKLALLDFGASRSYEESFIMKYIDIIKAAVDGERDKVLKLSQEMGFLTGYESKAMQDAHVDAVVILAEVFSSDNEFDFGHQDTTRRIQKLVPTIVSERLCPPPEEIYSLHRKLSGIFLFCAKLKVKISCRQMFLDMYNKYKRKEYNISKIK